MYVVKEIVVHLSTYIPNAMFLDMGQTHVKNERLKRFNLSLKNADSDYNHLPMGKQIAYDIFSAFLLEHHKYKQYQT